MKRLSFFCFALLCAAMMSAQTQNQYYVAYIETYHQLAQKQQQQHLIPASITLAQGLLESSAGRSELAMKANNHFGIKCGGEWKGASVTKDDDRKDECFRKYRRVEESYEDHSKFLLRDRYKPLFALPITDYKGWARGLKQCGYATDPGYADKLIRIIETYNLTQYDQASQPSSTKKPAIQEAEIEKETVEAEPESKGKTSSSSSAWNEVELAVEHAVYRNNGARYVIAEEGDTFESIAYEFNIYLSSLYKYNDILNRRYQLQPGDKVYLQLKHRKAAKQFAHYRVKRGENIWQIAQDKGVRLSTIYKLNGIPQGQDVMINQDLRLR
ncbi:MAG: glucosaminidase domain-containing protein [Paludibacteraceae bacterium]